jgi:hypothetical protein
VTAEAIPAIPGAKTLITDIHFTSTSVVPTVERDISIGEAGDVSVGDLYCTAA